MTTNRTFCRFSKSPATAPFSLTEIPPGGMCLSSFVILTEAGRPNRVLMGHMNPEAPWDHLGALDSARVETHSRGWMLPSSHLIFHEDPDEAARRILQEQLEVGELALDGPRVFSEVYGSPRRPEGPAHWDLEFLYRGTWPAGRAPAAKAWRKLSFVDTATVRKADMARSHEDILAHIGYAIPE